jgi:2-desacetyl-2-hydroxyethyl bacteriochlorophyllide A dehydrogenase
MFMVILCAATNAFGQVESTTMKAIVAHEYGPPKVARFEDAPVPAPKDNEALVKVIAAGVNPADALAVSGRFAKEWGTQLPLIPGYDIAGTVVKAGAAVTRLKPGDAVYGYPLMGGGWAQYCVVAETDAALKPKSVTYAEAASVPLAALTAWQALVDTIGLKKDQTILIQGGSGGVGSMAVQLAKLRGARVLATASTANQEMLKQLGADVAIDYTKQKFEDLAKDVDAVLDTVGGETFIRSCKVVKKGGIICTLVGAEKPAGVEHLGIRVTGLWVKPNAQQLSEIAKLIDDKKLKPMVTQELPLSDGVKALEQAATHHTRGKVVLKVADVPQS